METIISDKVFDEERALYNLQNARVEHCTFAGPTDGESVLKECRNVEVANCDFSLRYPLWHADHFKLCNSRMDELTRAPIWYAADGKIENCTINGIKILRECDRISLCGCKIDSPEFGWRCRDIEINDSEINSEYFLFECRNVKVDGLKMKGKYSFQYIENMKVDNSELDTKDAFWHSKNVTVQNSVVKGEYLGWYSENLTFINCKIIGTQPLCYCKGLKLMNCEMIDTDLAFEYSDVLADVHGEILSVKNPKSGRILADSYGKIVLEHSIIKSECAIDVRE